MNHILGFCFELRVVWMSSEVTVATGSSSSLVRDYDLPPNSHRIFVWISQLVIFVEVSAAESKMTVPECIALYI